MLAPDPHARLVSVEVAYAAGAADDPDGLRGLAHMVEHLVATRTKHVVDVMRELEAAGACHMNAVTSLDATTYFESVPPERLPTALWIESDRMGHAAEAVTDARISAQAAIIANEGRDRNLDSPLASVGGFTLREIFPEWHPYAPVEGSGNVDRIRADDVLAFLHTWYLPSNATLVVAGAFDRDATLAVVTRDFGGLPSWAPPTRPPLPDWAQRGAWLGVRAATPHDKMIVAWKTPAYGTKDDAALDVAATVLAGAGNGRLTPLLVATNLAIGVRARQASFRRGSVFAIEVTLAPAVNISRVAQVAQSAVDELARADIANETARARDVWRNATLESLETTWGRAARLITTDIAGEPGPRLDWGFGRRAAIDAGMSRGPPQDGSTLPIASSRSSSPTPRRPSAACSCDARRWSREQGATPLRGVPRRMLAVEVDRAPALRAGRSGPRRPVSRGAPSAFAGVRDCRRRAAIHDPAQRDACRPLRAP